MTLLDQLRFAREDVHAPLAVIIVILAVNNITNGLDQGWWAGIIGNFYFASVFGESTLDLSAEAPGYVIPWLSAGQQSTVSTTAYAAAAVGALMTGAIVDRVGFRPLLLLMALLVIVGSVIEITSAIGGYRWAQIIVGKVIIGWTNGLVNVVAPTYISEIAPQRCRGSLVAVSQLFVTVGGILSAVMVWALSDKLTSSVWNVPIGVQFAASLVAIATFFVIPESPRWLLLHGRDDQARRSLLRIRKGTPDYEVEVEMALLSDGIRSQKQDRVHAASWAQVFKGTDLKRLLIVVGLQCYQVATGLVFLGNYLVVLFIQIGIQNPYVVNIVVTCVSFISIVFNMLLVDYVGRRRLLIGGAVLMTAALASFAALVTRYSTELTGAIGNACAALIILWFLFFISTWSTTPWATMTELPAAPCREKTVGITLFFSGSCSMLISAVNPYLQNADYANLGAKVGFIYAAVSASAVVWTFFAVPETKGRSLEELDELFKLKVGVRAMGKYKLPPKLVTDSATGSNADAKVDVEHFEG